MHTIQSIDIAVALASLDSSSMDVKSICICVCRRLSTSDLVRLTDVFATAPPSLFLFSKHALARNSALKQDTGSARWVSSLICEGKACVPAG